MAKRDFAPVTPGEILLEEFLQPVGISQYRLAKEIIVPQRRISEIVHGRRSITADTALRIGRYFGMEAQFWLNLQTRYDLLRAEEELDDRLEKEVTPHADDPARVVCGSPASQDSSVPGCHRRARVHRCRTLLQLQQRKDDGQGGIESGRAADGHDRPAHH